MKPLRYYGYSYNGYTLNQMRLFDVDKKTKITPHFQSKEISRVLAIGCHPTQSTVLTYHEVAGRGTVREWDLGAILDWKLIREWEIPEGEWVSALVAQDPPLIALRRSQSTALYRWPKGEKPTLFWEIAGHFYDFGQPLASGEWPAIGNVSGREEVWALNFQKHWARKVISVLGGVDSFDVFNNHWLVSSYRHGGYDIAEAKPVAEDTEIRTDLTASTAPVPSPLTSARISQ